MVVNSRMGLLRLLFTLSLLDLQNVILDISPEEARYLLRFIRNFKGMIIGSVHKFFIFAQRFVDVLLELRGFRNLGPLLLIVLLK